MNHEPLQSEARKKITIQRVLQSLLNSMTELYSTADKSYYRAETEGRYASGH